MKDKKEFYDALWNDYYDLNGETKENCFLYGYLKKKKDHRAEIIGRSKSTVIEYSKQKKRDNFILLKSAYYAVTRYKVMTEQEYADILKLLLGANLPAKYKNINGQDAMDRAEEMLERRFLLGCIGDFFYNLGYRTNVNVEHSHSVKVQSRATKEDGYTDEFDMLYEFNKYRGEDTEYHSIIPVNSIDSEYIEKCNDLYDALCKDKQRNAFIPLFVDSNTGAGVYIVGVDRFDKESSGYENKKTGDVCYVCIIYFQDFDSILNSYGQSEDILTLNMSIMERHLSVKKAFDSFEKIVSGQEFYQNYPYENDEKPTSYIDDRFDLFFYTIETGRQKMEALMTEDMLTIENKLIIKKEEENRRLQEKTKYRGTITTK